MTGPNNTSFNKFISPIEVIGDYQDTELKRIIINYIKFKFNDGLYKEFIEL